jgi:hypothetical protein
MLEHILQRSFEKLAEDIGVLAVRVAKLEHTVLERVVQIAELRGDLHQLWSVPSLDLRVAS